MESKGKGTIQWEPCPFGPVCFIKGNNFFFLESVFVQSQTFDKFSGESTLALSDLLSIQIKGYQRRGCSERLQEAQDKGLSSGISSLLHLCLRKSVSFHTYCLVSDHSSHLDWWNCYNCLTSTTKLLLWLSSTNSNQRRSNKLPSESVFFKLQHNLAIEKCLGWSGG